MKNKFETGRHYRTRDGRCIARVVCVDREDGLVSDPFNVIALYKDYYSPNAERVRELTAAGRVSREAENGDDLLPVPID
ncbi:MAG: hypothetical protein LBR12_02005 [Opitutaceae bacterium]|jgi:hypothetical protein|nr:hypothetical protein [Opitutaceae bacterium]